MIIYARLAIKIANLLCATLVLEMVEMELPTLNSLSASNITIGELTYLCTLHISKLKKKLKDKTETAQWKGRDQPLRVFSSKLLTPWPQAIHPSMPLSTELA